MNLIIKDNPLLADVCLPLSGLTVLIGESGTGKSTIIQRVQNAQPWAWSRLADIPATDEEILVALRPGFGRELLGVRQEPKGLFLRFPGSEVHEDGLSSGDNAWVQITRTRLLVAAEGAGYGVLAIDDVEHNLHPGMIVRATWVLEEIAEKVPVIVSTHSPVLLGVLENPAACVVHCGLEEDRKSYLRTIDAGSLLLANWKNLGELWLEGYLPHVLGEHLGGPA